MKAVILSIICRLLAFIAVLAFVFAIVFTTGNTNFLWLLWLLLTTCIVPTYSLTREYDDDDEIEEN